MSDASEEIFDSPVGWVNRHIRSYVDSGGRKGHRHYGWPTLLLTTRGRRSGKLRRSALIYDRDGDSYVVVGSNGGKPEQPAWYLNLSADPRVTVQVGTEIFAAQARDATAEERAGMWERMLVVNPGYADYEKRAGKAGRQIPVVVLERA
ncbi:nitroreductase family deazaflavin-dependent oxidoreductase [Phytohabitans flavus]|uniref:Nitroreductase n=1 Tax=Phytohabitans flavus TaxID=1076124 RepID=A0A6F8Y0R0_9ACTN|nr:nitroreductase [Phytohabitans flavus]